MAAGTVGVGAGARLGAGKWDGDGLVAPAGEDSIPCSWLVEALERLLEDEDDEADAVMLVLDDAVLVSGMLCVVVVEFFWMFW